MPAVNFGSGTWDSDALTPGTNQVQVHRDPYAPPPATPGLGFTTHRELSQSEQLAPRNIRDVRTLLPLPGDFSMIIPTEREKLIDEAGRGNRASKVSSLPLRSTLSIKWLPYDALPTGAGNIKMCHLVAEAGQQLNFFAYAMGDAIPDGLGSTRVSSELDTNMELARSISGDAAIDSLSMACAGHRIKYATAPGDLSTPVVQRAYLGTARSFDPAALMKPRQADSPMNLEEGLFGAIRSASLVELVFGGGTKTVKLGVADEIPDGGARSYLRATGENRFDNRKYFREGIRLKSDNTPESKFSVRMTLMQDIVVPVDLVLGLYGTAGNAVEFSAIATDIVLRMHGIILSAADVGACPA